MHAKLIYLQPTPVRIWHWLNALGIVTLIISGIQIRFPDYVSICGSYRDAILLHNTAGIVVALSFSFWFFYYKWVSGALTNIYVPKMDELSNGLIKQMFFTSTVILKALLRRFMPHQTANSTRCRNQPTLPSCL
jgi:thiosulfate reductase cytochrome b subunit